MAVLNRRRVRDWATYPIGAVTPIIGTPRPAVVLTTGRSGSDLLISLLDSHPNIVCRGELLRAMSRVPPWHPGLRVDGEAVIAAHEARAAGKDVRVFGWKLLTTNLRWFPVQFPQPERFLEQRTRGGLLIVLRRRDYLAQALSWIDAEQREYHHTTGTASAFEPFVVDPEQLLAQVYAYELEDQWLEQVTAGQERLEIWYEDDLVDEARREAAVASITDRLGLPFAPTFTDLVAVAPRHPADRVANIDQVAAALEGTRYRRFLPA
jgi:LPS sulfotransferase NodH